MIDGSTSIDSAIGAAIRIARLCSKPLSFFEPAEQSQIAELAEAYPARSDALPAEASALQALTNALHLHER